MLCWSTKEAQSLLDSTRPLVDHYPVLEFIFGWLNQSWQQEFCPWGAKTFEHHSILISFTYHLKACVLQYLQPTRFMSIFCILVMYTAYRLQGVNGVICLSDISGLWFFSSTQSQALKFRLDYLWFIILYGKGERFHYQIHKKKQRFVKSADLYSCFINITRVMTRTQSIVYLNYKVRNIWPMRRVTRRSISHSNMIHRHDYRVFVSPEYSVCICTLCVLDFWVSHPAFFKIQPR